MKSFCFAFHFLQCPHKMSTQILSAIVLMVALAAVTDAGNYACSRELTADAGANRRFQACMYVTVLCLLNLIFRKPIEQACSKILDAGKHVRLPDGDYTRWHVCVEPNYPKCCQQAIPHKNFDKFKKRYENYRNYL